MPGSVFGTALNASMNFFVDQYLTEHGMQSWHEMLICLFGGPTNKNGSIRINSHIVSWEFVKFKCHILQINAFVESDIIYQSILIGSLESKSALRGSLESK